MNEASCHVRHPLDMARPPSQLGVIITAKQDVFVASVCRRTGAGFANRVDHLSTLFTADPVLLNLCTSFEGARLFCFCRDNKRDVPAFAGPLKHTHLKTIKARPLKTGRRHTKSALLQHLQLILLVQQVLVDLRACRVGHKLLASLLALSSSVLGFSGCGRA